MFPQFEFFGKTIGMYGICAVLGLIICGAVGYLCVKNRGEEPEDMILAVVFVGIGITIGGHLLFGLTNISKILAYFQTIDKFSFKEFFNLTAETFGGSVFYGGFIGSLIAISIYGKLRKKRVLYLDILAFSTPLFHTFGRIGCFLAGCCYGVECDFGFTAHGNVLIDAVNDISRFPVQLLEASFNFILFFILINFFRKEKHTGKLIYIYMASYAVIRFCTEFLRGDEIRGFFLFFSTSQWISLIIFPISIIMLIYLYPNKKSKS